MSELSLENVCEIQSFCIPKQGTQLANPNQISLHTNPVRLHGNLYANSHSL